jgi:hypothetical protein
MNKNQKGAWITLGIALYSIGSCSIIYFRLFVLKKPSTWFQFLSGIGGLILCIVLSILFLRKKQSPVEVETDERDKNIMKRAVLPCAISVGVGLAAVSAIPQLVVGTDGSIPVWVIPIMNLGVAFAATLVYTVAVLVQYGWGGKEMVR